MALEPPARDPEKTTKRTVPADFPIIRCDAYHGSGICQVVTDFVDYEIENAEDRIEIRRYPKMILATMYGHSDNDAFSILFDYIAGNNRSKRKISMTVPVISSEKIAMTAPVISDMQSFSFVLPTNYSLETIPDPLDTRARIEEVPARRVAVIRFRGHARQIEIERKTAELLAFIERLGLNTKGKPFLMRYNPPFTPGFLRRNEVGLEITS